MRLASVCDDGEREITAVLENSRSKFSLNGNPLSKASAFYGQFTCVAFTPEEMSLVQGPPGERRKFLDRVISMTCSSYVDSLVRYQRALRSRNRLLQEAKGAGNSLRDELLPWTKMLITYGRAIAARRQSAMSTLLKSSDAVYDSP